MVVSRGAMGVFGVCVFGAYLAGLAPSISVGDAGELATAAHTLGIPHPPGFPTYTLISHAAVHVVPWGNPGYRTNVLSAAEGSLAAVLMLMILLSSGVPWPLAALTSLWFGFTPVLYHNSTHTEVFAMHILLGLGAWGVALRSHWMLCGFLMGLAFGNHQTILLWGPSLFLLIPSDQRRHAILQGVMGGLIGLSIYLFLIFRGQDGPFLNVGRPDTLERLWRVMTRADYGTLTLALGDAPVRTGANLLAHLMRYLEGWSHQVGWTGILLAGAGAWGWWRHQRRTALALGLAWALSGPLFLLLANLPFDAQSTGVLDRFHLMPTAAGLLLTAGLGFFVPGTRGVIALAAALGWSALSHPVEPSRQEWEAYTYGRNTLKSLPPGSTFIMDGGDDTFYSLAYLTQVERRRRDLTFFDRGGIVFRHPYGPDFRRLNRDQKEERRKQVERALLRQGAALSYSTMNESLLGDVSMTQAGLVYRAAGPLRGDRALWAIYDFRGIAPWTHPSTIRVRDYRRRALRPFYAFQRAMDRLHAKQWSDASRWLGSAWAQGTDVVWLKPNLLYALHRTAFGAYGGGDVALARALYTHILRLEPQDRTAAQNLELLMQRKTT